MAIRNMHALVNRFVSGAVNPNFLGTWLASQGYTQAGDASITASITGDVLTVSAVASGSLAIGSLLTDDTFVLAPATAITGGSGSSWTVSPSQTVPSEAMTANGPGARTSGYTTFTGIPMQVQAVSGEDLKHLDGLNLQQTMRSVWLNGNVQGVQRPNMQGGDILQIPTGMTGNSYDVWLVTVVVENWNQGNWSHVIVTLQQPTVSQ